MIIKKTSLKIEKLLKECYITQYQINKTSNTTFNLYISECNKIPFSFFVNLPIVATDNGMQFYKKQHSSFTLCFEPFNKNAI